MNKSIIIVGRICSGKSTIAKSLGVLLASNPMVISFGEYLKDYCLKRNLKFDRQFLQNIGQEFIDKNPGNFLRKVVEFSSPKEGQILIFEGVRHKSIFEAISKLYPSIASIFIDIDVDIRYNRYKVRKRDSDGEISFEDFLKRDNHKVESEIELLKLKCSLILHNGSQEDHLYALKNHFQNN